MMTNPPVEQLRTCAVCGGWYFTHPEEARQAHATVMGHQAQEKDQP